MADADRHERAREQSIQWLVEAIRRGDYLDAVQWLNTLAAVDRRFTLTPDDIIATWRERAARYRRGLPAERESGDQEGSGTDYRGLFGALLRNAYDGIVISAVEDGWMLECSDSFVRLTGYSRPQLLGKTSVELGLIEPAVRRAAVDATEEQRAAGGFATKLRRRDGDVRVVEFSPQVLAGDQLLLTIVRDITERKLQEERIQRLADTDPLTKLFNRRRFQEEVERRIVDARRHGDPVTLLAVDLDDFKAVNDTHGHHVGDEILTAVGEALCAAVRETDVVGRLGGDEFGVLLSRAHPSAAERVVREVRGRLAAAGGSTPLGETVVRASIGTAELSEELGDYAALMKAADEAMYRDKTWKPS